MSTINELRSRKEKAALGGGEARIEAQHERGKLTARERLGLLYDAGTFVEIGGLRKHRCTDFGMDKVDAPGDGVVTGYGLVNGRLVYAFAQDFTVQGGSLGEIHAAKISHVQDEALKNGAPIVGLLDSGGARIQEGVSSLMGFGDIFYRNTISSGVIPQISAIMGPCAGGAVYSPAITDFIFMVERTSNMFITGPEVIKTVTGEEVTSEALGGAAVHNARSGVAHFRAANDQDCIAQIKALLTYLPSNNTETAPLVAPADDPNRACPVLDTIVPESDRKSYDMKRVIAEIVDAGSFYEVQPDYAKNIITGYARLNGRTIGIIASQPLVAAGCLDIDASDKAARFIRRCDAFNTPLLTLVDVPGFLPGTGQEFGGIIRHGAKMLYAYSEATVPKLTLVTRKAYGGAYIGMCCKALGADATFAWPTAEIAVMGAAGAANIVFRKEIKAAEDPEAKRAEKIKEYEDKFSGPYFAAEHGYIDDVIEPNETRVRLINALEANLNKRQSLPAKKHGNIPL
ncbi:MAG: methylmalonyl-CoA carboxyltransferase [Lachnospiraceae bacterium]|nr:methylmalonyl-CoA carboxyltransferase [Lachnospiraceae bacterium]